MSTLAATKADGFYYPPDWTPEGGSASLARKFNKNGSLGKRANKLHEGKLTVRFEMPYNVGCRRCGQTIARGVRFNAEKRVVGKYHSTPIYAFTMLTSCCANQLEIHTDPKDAEYVIVSGADRRIGGAGAATRYNDHAKGLDAEGTTEIELQSREERDAMMADPMGRLERTVGMVRAAEDGDGPSASGRAPPTFIELRDRSKNRWKDDYEAKVRHEQSRYTKLEGNYNTLRKMLSEREEEGRRYKAEKDEADIAVADLEMKLEQAQLEQPEPEQAGPEQVDGAGGVYTAGRSPPAFPPSCLLPAACDPARLDRRTGSSCHQK